ncbi:MAG: 50S ribosome-binding GTPase [Candidatus Lokiarchaeota archaeon]|jgi:GTPase SAR1 family protein|nr:50S ribosome-binding GTPase [Candidatus Lokiarchaeota archaeon]
MSSDITNIITIFSKFLDPKVTKADKFNTIEEIKKLPVHSYKFISKNDAKILKDLLKISRIDEISKLNRDNPFENLKIFGLTKDPLEVTELQEEFDRKVSTIKAENPEFENAVKKAIFISSIITTMVDEGEILQKSAQKVIVIGLDNAGKTAILSKFGGRLGISDLANLTPTKGVDRRHIETANSDIDLYIWDFGGQAQYRSKYIDKPEQYFLQTDLLIYVIDVQDSERYAESFEYFEQILNILSTLEEDPFVLIYIHKCDPDLKRDPETLLNIELLKDNLNQLLTTYDYDYEAYLTSIFSLITNEPEFSKYIKEVMRSTDSLTNPTLRKVEGLGKTLEETMNAVIRLSESLSKQLSELDNRLRAIESGAFQMAQSGVLIGLTPPGDVSGSGSPGDSRSKVLDELKQLFEKKRKLNL